MILLNGNPVVVTSFPNKEMCINQQKMYIKPHNQVILKYEEDRDLMVLFFVQQYLQDLKVASRLIIKYMPYSRMDRVNDSYLFTLKYICKFINNMNFYNVTVVEPHSDVTIHMLKDAKPFFTSVLLAEQILLEEQFDISDYVYYPDAGAQQRYTGTHFDLYNQAWGEKERDFNTGEIVGLEVHDIKPGSKDFKVLIVDDLCSRGGTFLQAATKLRELGATRIILVVTHCEDNIHTGELLSGALIDKIYTTDSILTHVHPKIELWDVQVNNIRRKEA